MRTSRILPSILLAFGLCGCSKTNPEVELTKYNFSKFDSSKLTKVYIVSSVVKSDPNRGQAIYHYEFPINDHSKVEVMKRCIKDANHTEYDIARFKKRRTGQIGNSGLFVFETKKLRYTMRIGWDDKSAYGFWWESPELLSIFKGWGLLDDLAKADPNWPPLHYQVQTTTRKIIEAGQLAEENK